MAMGAHFETRCHRHDGADSGKERADLFKNVRQGIRNTSVADIFGITTQGKWSFPVEKRSARRNAYAKHASAGA